MRSFLVIALSLSAFLYYTGAGHTQSNGSRIKLISAAIKHFRLQNATASLLIHDEVKRDNTAKTIFRSTLNPQQIKDIQESPNGDVSTSQWISDGEQLRVNVLLQGNLLGDKGSGQYRLVKSEYAVRPNAISQRETYRRRIRSARSNQMKDNYVKIGRINLSSAILVDGCVQEYREIDPRCISYFLDDRPLDEYLDEKIKCEVADLGDETLFGDKCTKIRITRHIPVYHQVIVYDCWVDKQHDYILRHVLCSGKNDHTSGVVLDRASKIVFQDGDRWFPAEFEDKSWFPTSSGRDSSNPNVVRHINISPLPALSDPETANPFAIRWKSGTKVRDLKTMKLYIADKKENLMLLNTN